MIDETVSDGIVITLGTVIETIVIDTIVIDTLLRAFARASAKRLPGQYWRSEHSQGRSPDANRHERP